VRSSGPSFSWWSRRGYELTDHELIVHAWSPFQSSRFDRE
jgi:hypothetical protein